MCGICGIWCADENDLSLLVAMASSLKHRGPDHTGHIIESPVALAMTRLSIIDFSGGIQPMHSADGQVSLVFNGEIYNFRELRAEIEPHIPFHTRSDTEVILNGYLLWGTDVFRRLNGMFAIALWDRTKAKFYMARDPMGIKPFYYLEQDGKLFFASEIKTFTLLRLANHANRSAISQFLTTCYVFHPETAIEGVKQVKPGTYLTLQLTASMTEHVFRIPGGNGKELPISIDAAEEQIGEALHTAVIRQTVADVPYGLLLSSGLDSTAIVSALRRRHMTQNLRTYTLYFPDNQDFSEDLPIRELAAQMGFDSTFVPFQVNDLKQNWDAICTTFDNLDLLPTAPLIYVLGHEAARDRRMVLAGNGGDELFLGYPTYVASQWVRRFRFLSPVLQAILPKIASFFPASSDYLSLSEKGRRFCLGYADNPALAHAQWRHIFTVNELQRLLSHDYQAVSAEALYAPQLCFHTEAHTLGRHGAGADQWMDLRTWMIDSGLMMWDKAGMASSLEIRVPIIDLDLVDLVLSLPDKIRSGGQPGSKGLLRKTVTNDLPPSITTLPKHGFQMPLDQWMRTGLRDMFRDLTFSLPTHVFKHTYIDKLWQDFDARRGDHALKLWALGALSGWKNQHNVEL